MIALLITLLAVLVYSYRVNVAQGIEYVPHVTPPLRISYAGTTDNSRQPEPSIAASENIVIVVSNFQIATYSKSNAGSLIYRSSFFQGSVDFYPAYVDSFYFDPYVIYDKLWNRFYFVSIANNYAAGTSYYAIAISKPGANPRTKSDWCFYYRDASRFGTTPENLVADRLSLTSTDGHLFIAANMFNHDNNGMTTFAYAKVTALDFRNYDSTTCTGTPPGVDYKNFLHESTNAPAVRGMQAVKVVGGDAFFAVTPAGSGNYITLFNIEAKIVGANVFRRTIAVSPFTNTGPMRQPVGTVVNANETRIMQAEIRGNYLWMAQETKDLQLGATNASVRTYQYNLTNNSTVTQPREGNGIDIGFGGIAVNSDNVAIVIFNRSTTSAPDGFISIRYGEFSTTSDLIKAGENNSIANFGRWGDYAAITTDHNEIDFWISHLYTRPDGLPGIWIASTLSPHKNVWITFANRGS